MYRSARLSLRSLSPDSALPFPWSSSMGVMSLILDTGRTLNEAFVEAVDDGVVC